MDTRTSTVSLRLARVRDALAERGLAAVLVPSSDPHLSEYPPERWQGREWLSGFTGSAGTLVVARARTALFTDSRYWEQAERELQGSGIDLVKVVSASPAHHIDWLVERLRPGESLGVDASVLGVAAAQQLRDRLREAGVSVVDDFDVLAAAWPERPGLPAAPVYEHRPPHAPQPRADKLAKVREAMRRHGATHHFVSTLDDIAWLFNLRGADVPYNPVFLAHALIDDERATLYVAPGKADEALARRLAEDGVAIADYADAPKALAALGERRPPARLLIDPRRVTWGLRRHVPEGVELVEAINPSTLLKSRKSADEAAHIREAMAEDGAAMCAFYAAFEAALARGERLTELSVDEGLSAERAKRADFMGLSFPTIAGFAGNGAMPHYRATPESHAAIAGDGLLLIDSGAQYLGGTTDITRVWPIGRPSDAERRDYTLVLKGTIALSRARFPRGTPGPMLDAIARLPLWQHGLDFGHGTGHGVGYFLNVHEGPQSISKITPEPQMALEAGMVTSVEPGVYRPGRWGVRIENLVLAVECPTPEAGAFGEFLEFETLTMCPIDTRCLDRGLLREEEVAWLNAYHATVRERLAPRVEGAALEWLRGRTEAV